MKVGKYVRTFIWFTESIIKRYKLQLIIGFCIGIVLVIGSWRIGADIFRTIIPNVKTVGMVGSYEPGNMPLSVQQLISFGFTRVNDQGEAEPLVATNWEISPDGKRYFFHIRKNLTWHDGTEFTAFDVNYNFHDVTLSAADRYTLKVELNEPFSPLPVLLSRPLFKSGLVGLGPYRVVRFEMRNEYVKRLTLQPFDDPNTQLNEKQDKPIIDIRFYPTMDDAILAFQLGEVDYLDGINSKTPFEHEPNVVVNEQVQYDRFLGLFFNTKNEVLKSKEFRQALSYATPPPQGKSLVSPIAETSWAYNGTVKDYKYNMKQAKTQLEKAEVATNSPNLILTTFPKERDYATEIADSWNELGVHTTVRVVFAFPSEFDVILGIQEIPPDPDQYMLWHSTQDTTNITKYTNPKIDKLLEEGRGERDSEKRQTIYKDFQKYLIEDAPARFIMHPTVYTITRK